MLTVDFRDAMDAAATRWPRALSRNALREALEVMASDLLALSRGAFQAKKDPFSGASWAEPAPRTLRDASFNALLVRSGELFSSLTSDVRVGEHAGEAALTLPPVGHIVRRGLVHLFGAQKRRHNIPQRRWAGYPMGTVRRWAEVMRDIWEREAQ